jgi:hypothetical protein
MGGETLEDNFVFFPYHLRCWVLVSKALASIAVWGQSEPAATQSTKKDG